MDHQHQQLDVQQPHAEEQPGMEHNNQNNGAHEVGHDNQQQDEASNASSQDYGDASENGDGDDGDGAGPPAQQQKAAVPDDDPVRGKGCGQHGCAHYRRRAQIIAPCCNEAFWCRHCHNAVKYDNEQEMRHVVDRKQVREVVCALCSLRQPTGLTCIKCGVAFGRYSCLVCNFFDDDLNKQCFHCDECGICRVGGRDNFFHCKTCNCCYALSLRDSHVCIENSMHHNCPVCFEYLFDSIKPINIMPCGHTIHQECLRSLVEHHTYTCPVCMKSIMTSANMESIWERVEQEIVNTPMPEEYRGLRVDILCNDCNARSNVAFHVVGHKCQECGSFNTRRV